MTGSEDFVVKNKKTRKHSGDRYAAALSSLIQTFPIFRILSVRELHPVSPKARGLYRRYGISPIPQRYFFYYYGMPKGIDLPRSGNAAAGLYRLSTLLKQR